MTDPLPPVAELLPHSGPMVLLSDVIDHDAKSTSCTAEPESSELFRAADGRIPSWVGIEYMAQCIAVDGALRAREAGAELPIGLFLGSRKLRFKSSHFEPGRKLEITARHIAGDASLVAFQCEIRDRERHELLAEGRLSVYVPRDLGSLGPEAGRGH